MRRVTIVVPYLASGPDRESALRPMPPALQRVVEGATVVKLAPLAPSATPEAALLAMNPEDAVVAQGPLTVAALGHQPPERSAHFHLTLCSVDEGGVLSPVSDVQERVQISELDALFGAAARLKTPSLTPLRGEGPDHALVWENGSLEVHTAKPSDAFGHDVFSMLPRGEGEELLRRFVDDSVNLLNTLESNHERREEGLPPLNCLWPWGQGFRPDLPNLPLRRGDVLHVVSGSMRMQGLCRLVGYAHGDRHKFGTKLQTNYDMVRENATAHRLSLAVIHSIEEMQQHGRTDEIAWNLEQLSSKVVAPLIEAEEPFELWLAAPGGHCSVGTYPEGASSTGLALTFVSDRQASNTVPFDERVFDDARVPTKNVWEFLHPGFLGLE